MTVKFNFHRTIFSLIFFQYTRFSFSYKLEGNVLCFLQKNDIIDNTLAPWTEMILNCFEKHIFNAINILIFRKERDNHGNRCGEGGGEDCAGRCALRVCFLPAGKGPLRRPLANKNQGWGRAIYKLHSSDAIHLATSPTQLRRETTI